MSNHSQVPRVSTSDTPLRSTKHSLHPSMSINRSTVASETRSIRSRNEDPNYTTTRKPSLRIVSKGAQMNLEQNDVPVRSRISTSSNHSIAQSKTTPFSSTANARSKPPVSSEPGIVKSFSTNSLSSQLSPRRAGLAARTISPVEIQRNKRNSQLLELGKSKLGHDPKAPRKVSGIPSPVRAPAYPRTRPSPVPPIPPMPKEIPDLGVKRNIPVVVRSAGRSVSVPTGNLRQRSATVNAQKTNAEPASANDLKTSFTSPVKKKVANDVANHSIYKVAEATTLPPLKVQNLSTPTVRRVNDMSQRLHAPNTLKSVEPQDPTGVSTDKANHTPLDSPKVTGSNLEIVSPSLSEPAPKLDTALSTAATNVLIEPVASPKGKDFNGLFSRLSLSRSSSRSKLKKKMSSENLDDNESSTTQGGTPERRRRLSLSWMKGKMSPFGNSSSSIPKVDPGIPPSIPKSFTSESLATMASHSDDLDISQSVRTASNSAENSMSWRRSRTSTEVRSASTTSTPLPTSASSRDTADEEMRRQLISSRGSKHLVEARALADALSVKAVPRNPVMATEVATLGDSPLNLYEKGEVIDYDGEIYFTGQRDIRKTGGRLDSALNINFGYDDERGDYLVNPGDHFAYRYEIVDVLGKGSFGQVLRCIDYKTGGLTAVKVIRNKQRFHAQALVEAKILKLLRQWDPLDTHHLIKYNDHFHFRNHLCIATDLLGMNLYEYLKANDFKGCTPNMIRSFATQILTCLDLLREQRVIHCDLKPENILLVNMWESRIKVIDFGSSCFENQKVYTYIQSRFYRSPEVILGLTYGLPIDIWSMACILAELFTGHPIFPGEDEHEQLACIMEIFGPPEKHLVDASTRKVLFFDQHGKPRSVVTSKGRRRKPSTKTLSQATKCTDEAFLDFLTRCLRWDPNLRMTPAEALKHPFITKQPMSVLDSPKKVRRFVSNQMTSLPPRVLPKHSGRDLQSKQSSPYRSTSITLASTMGSPSKSHRRVVSSIPLPRERVVT